MNSLINIQILCLLIIINRNVRSKLRKKRTCHNGKASLSSSAHPSIRLLRFRRVLRRNCRKYRNRRLVTRVCHQLGRSIQEKNCRTERTLERLATITEIFLYLSDWKRQLDERSCLTNQKIS